MLIIGVNEFYSFVLKDFHDFFGQTQFCFSVVVGFEFRDCASIHACQFGKLRLRKSCHRAACTKDFAIQNEPHTGEKTFQSPKMSTIRSAAGPHVMVRVQNVLHVDILYIAMLPEAIATAIRSTDLSNQGHLMTARNQNWMGYRPDQLIPRLRSLCDDLTALDKGGSITLSTDPVGIEDWALMRRAVPCLAGVMQGHPHITEGNFGFTTEIFYLDQDLGMARSMSRWYRLGSAMREEPGKALAEALLRL
jgi:hypothetical protein